jgi:hypothetical protein
MINNMLRHFWIGSLENDLEQVEEFKQLILPPAEAASPILLIHDMNQAVETIFLVFKYLK